MNENERPLFNSAATGDDGSLAALNIAPDENNKHFNCSETARRAKRRSFLQIPKK